MIGIIITLILTMATATAFAANGATETTTDAASSEEAFMITFGDPFADVSGLAVSKEEATRIGMEALAEFYGVSAADLAEYFTAQVYYNPPIDPRSYWDMPEGYYDYELDEFVGNGTVRENTPDEFFPMNVHKGFWLGSLLPSNRGEMTGSDGPMIHSHDTYRFSVDAETGELLGLQYFISVDPARKAGQQYDKFESAMKVFEYAQNMTADHNAEYAKHAMQVAEELNIFEGKVRRAAVIAGGWMPGKDSSFELCVYIAVECANGEIVGLTFQGRERKELTDIKYITRQVDYAVDKDGGIVEPEFNLVGTPDSIYDFGWVYR